MSARVAVGWTVLVALALSGTAAAQPAVPVFDDDFESGNLSRWTLFSDGGVAVAASAAHRGAWGLAATAPAVGQSAFVEEAVVPSAATLYAARFWMKAPPPPNSGQVGIATVYGTLTGLNFVLAEVRLTYAGSAITLELGGSTPPSSQTVIYTGTPTPIDASWHLVEIAVMNIHTPAGVGARSMWVDGQQVAVSGAGDLSSVAVSRVTLGVADVYAGGLNGALAFDDYRLTAQALSASQFFFPTLPPVVGPNQCLEMDVALESSELSGQYAPYTFDAGMKWVPDILTFYSDPSCGQPSGGGLPFTVGAPGVKTYFIASPGTTQLCASYVDFLCFSRSLTVAALIPDAGVGGDGGVTLDGGASPDGGSPALTNSFASLGCASGPLSGLGWGLLALIAFRRRGRRRL